MTEISTRQARRGVSVGCDYPPKSDTLPDLVALSAYLHGGVARMDIPESARLRADEERIAGEALAKRLVARDWQEIFAEISWQRC
jgi:hypothetical protein